jgi:hypothetical protein
MTVWSLRLFVNFEALKKYQDGIRFQIQNGILEELDEIYNFDVTTSFLDLSIKSNDWLKLKTFCKTLKHLKSTKTVSDFKFKIGFWKNSTRSTIWTLQHLFWIFQSRAMPVWSLRLLVKLWSIKKYQDGIRFQIQNTILKKLDEIYNLDVTASFLNLSIKCNDCLKFKTFCKTLKH